MLKFLTVVDYESDGRIEKNDFENIFVSIELA